MERATQFDLNNNDKYATHYHSERTQKRCDMDDILIALDDTDDPRLAHRVLSYVNEEEYDTDSFIYDFNKNDHKMQRVTGCLSWEQVHQMKDISVITIEDVLRFIRNKQYKDSDLAGKEMYVVCYRQNSNQPILYETHFPEQETYRIDGREILGFLKSKDSKECRAKPQEYGIYDLDGLFGDGDSQTIRERCHDECRKNTKKSNERFFGVPLDVQTILF
eukprot:956283_1